MAENETYLGDAVYASFDGFRLWLRTGDAFPQRIALEPAVLAALDAYRKELIARHAAPESPPALPTDE